MLPSPSTVPAVLPDEIVFSILHLLDPSSIIRLRLVSKQFNDVACDARLWRILYANSCLPRPSGPFLWQSTRYLQHALIHSARVSRTWTSQPLSVISCAHGPRIRAQPYAISTPSDFLFGRLFIWCEYEQILVQDLETGIGRVLWESDRPISSLHACSLTFSNAERVFVAIRHVDVPVSQRTPMHVYFLLPRPSVVLTTTFFSKLLEFPLDDDASLKLGPLLFEMDLPEYVTFPLFANAPFLFFHDGLESILGSCEPTVVDLRTWTTYRFPMFSSRLVDRDSFQWCHECTMLSGDHIVVFSPWESQDPPMTLVQAFVSPNLLKDPSNTDRLHLTHEVLVEYHLAPTHCIRRAVVNSTTGETTMRFLGSSHRREQTNYRCIDITIPPIDLESTRVLPMSVKTQELFSLSGYPQATFLDASDDGHGRGIVTLCMPLDLPHCYDFTLFLYKFSLDASGDNCTAVVAESSRLDPQDAFYCASVCIFDAIRGRVCHSMKKHSKFFDLTVLDLH